MNQATIEVLLQPEMLSLYSFTLTQLAKKMNTPKQFLPLISTAVGAFAGLILSLPVQTLDTMNMTLQGAFWGLVTTMTISFAKEFKKPSA